MNYNLREIMLRAWENRRKRGIPFPEALHRSWLSEKQAPVNAARIEAAKAAAGITEAVNTWNGWRLAGMEVNHGEKARFSVSLLYGSKGDGATYTASFFTASQVAVIA